MKLNQHVHTVASGTQLRVGMGGLTAMGIPTHWYLHKDIRIRDKNRLYMLRKHPEDLPVVLRKLHECPNLLDQPIAYGRHKYTGQASEYNDRFEVFYRINGKEYILVFECSSDHPECIYLFNCYEFNNFHNRTNEKAATGLCIKVG